MEDRMEPQTNRTAYTEREKELAEWFDVEPELIRALREVAERIRATNVTSWTNPLVCQDS
jgi:hypothetical protein